MWKKLDKIWKETPIGEDIDCAFCMDIVTNGDCMITSCNHYYHTTCYLNYINSAVNNYRNNNQFSNNFNNIFKCPKCRNDLINYELTNSWY